MKLEEKIGQLLVVGLPGRKITEGDRRLIEEVRPGNFILFERNARSPAQLRDLCQHLRALVKPQKPLILIDHEGGRVSRLPKPFCRFPSQALFGKAGDTALTEVSFFASALELSAIGINMHLSPVLDVWTNPKNRVIGDRAFGRDPHAAAEMGTAAMRGILRAGLLPVGKHFPGHGGTTGDSHVELPRSRVARRTILGWELIPFRAVIKAGLPALMTAHVVFPALDPEHPASLSKKIVTGLLRKKMGFRGLILTDDLQMGAIAQHYPLPEAALLALEAGADLLLICHGKKGPREVAKGLRAAFQEGRLPMSRLEESLTRIRRAKVKPQRAQPLSLIGCEEHQKLVEEILKRTKNKI